MLKKKELLSILDCSLQTGADFAELFFEKKETNYIKYEDNRVESISTNNIKGVGIRIIKDEEEVYGYTNILKIDSILELNNKLADRFKGKKKVIIPGLKKKKIKLSKKTVYASEIPFNQKKSYMKKIYDYAKNYDKKINQVIVEIIDTLQQVEIVNSNGVYINEERISTKVSVASFAKEQNKIEYASNSVGKTIGYEVFNDIDFNSFGIKASEAAIIKLKAENCPAGVMPVVIGKGSGAILFHEACGHSLEATTVGRGTSILCGKLNKQVASPLVTLIDDGTLKQQWGHSKIDDEGNKTKRNILIEDGILKKYFIDYKNSKKMNMLITGSGRRESYKFSPDPRMNNTFILKGESTFSDIIKSIDFGLYAKKLGGGSVNPITDDFNFGVNEGFLIEKGKITLPVKGATIIGKGLEVLNKIEMIGNDFIIEETGFCGYESGKVPVSTGQPTVKISNLIVGGIKEVNNGL